MRLKCTKFDFGWGSAPDPAGGAYSAPPDPLAGFKGSTSKGMEGKGKEGDRKDPHCFLDKLNPGSVGFQNGSHSAANVLEHLRTSKAMRKPNFDEFSQSTTEILLLPVSDNKRPP